MFINIPPKAFNSNNLEAPNNSKTLQLKWGIATHLCTYNTHDNKPEEVISFAYRIINLTIFVLHSILKMLNEIELGYLSGEANEKKQLILQ